MMTAQDLVGHTLDGRYRLTRLLGEGAMGQVYEGIQVSLDRKVAIKLLHPRLAYERRSRERFLLEAKAASRIQHPNVVQILDFGETTDGAAYFVMEHLEGRDLRELLREQAKLPWSRAREILAQAARALGAAHARSVVHRDVKPANCFLLGPQGTHRGEVVKLLDFGIAKVGTDASGGPAGPGLTGTGEVFGTASYMAPEQARGEPLDARTDVYALGIMAYEMLTGQVPFSGANAIQVVTKHLHEAPRAPRLIEPSIPPAVEAIVLEAIAKEPKDRFASMVELEEALLAVPATSGSELVTTMPVPLDPFAAPHRLGLAQDHGVAVMAPPGTFDRTASLVGGTDVLPETSPTATRVPPSPSRPRPAAAWPLAVGMAVVAILAAAIVGTMWVRGHEPPATAAAAVEPAQPPVPPPIQAQAPPEDEPAARGGDHERTTGTPTRDAVIVEEPEEPVADLPAPTEEPSEAVPLAGSTDAVEKPRRTSPHLTAACVDRRRRAEQAVKARRWNEVLAATKASTCWSAGAQDERRSARIIAYAELRDFRRCVDAGRGVADTRAAALVKYCTKQLEE